MIDIVPVHVHAIVTAMKILRQFQKKIVQDLFHPKDWQKNGLIAVRRMKQHRDCDTSEGTWLPTRLLDVRHASKASVLRLVSTRKVSDAFLEEKRYITLSHCWGEWGSKEMPALTSANEQDRHRIGISIDKISQTFRDAITVTQWFQGNLPIPKQSSNSFMLSCSSMALHRLSVYYSGQRCRLATRGFADGSSLQARAPQHFRRLEC